MCQQAMRAAGDRLAAAGDPAARALFAALLDPDLEPLGMLELDAIDGGASLPAQRVEVDGLTPCFADRGWQRRLGALAPVFALCRVSADAAGHRRLEGWLALWPHAAESGPRVEHHLLALTPAEQLVQLVVERAFGAFGRARYGDSPQLIARHTDELRALSRASLQEQFASRRPLADPWEWQFRMPRLLELWARGQLWTDGDDLGTLLERQRWRNWSRVQRDAVEACMLALWARDLTRLAPPRDDTGSPLVAAAIALGMEAPWGWWTRVRTAQAATWLAASCAWYVVPDGPSPSRHFVAAGLDEELGERLGQDVQLRRWLVGAARRYGGDDGFAWLSWIVEQPRVLERLGS